MAARRGRNFIWYTLVFLLALALLIAARLFLIAPPKTVVAPPPPKPATAPTTLATAPATEPATPIELLDVLRLDDPEYPTTQPLEWPVELADAARIETALPLYLDPAGHLWMEHPKGEALQKLLKAPVRLRTHIVRQLPLYTHWTPGDDRPIVVAAGDGGKGVQIINGQSRGSVKRLADADATWRWRDAVPLGDDLLVPTPRGVVRIDLAKAAIAARGELFDAAAPKGAPHNPPLIFTTGERAYVWSPWENKIAGGDRVLMLTGDANAPPVAVENLALRLIQLTPLADGTILSVGTGDDGNVAVAFTDAPGLARAAAPAAAALQPTIDKLSDPDPQAREAAQRELEAMGPSIYPTLEALHDNLPVEAQLRIERVLGQRYAPTLGGLTPYPGPVETAARFAAGGCLLRLPGGGFSVDSDGSQQSTIPALIVMRPGRFVDRLPGVLAEAMTARARLYAFNNEYVLSEGTFGPRRWVGASLSPLLDKKLRHYSELIGIDATGRWLLRDPAMPGRTLILDRTLPDTRPRLPAWTITGLAQTGWNKAGMPMAVRNKQTFVLDENGWRRPEKDETLIALAPKVSTTTAMSDGITYTLRSGVIEVDSPAPPASAPSTTRAATTQSADGSPARSRRFTLPGTTSGDATLLLADGRLFVQIEPGVLLRLRPTPTGAAALQLDATFKKQIPAEEAKRVWLDPLGRIVFATGDSLTITFPSGRVPPGLANQVLIRGDQAEDEE